MKKILTVCLGLSIVLIFAMCTSTQEQGAISSYKAGPVSYTLQLLHFADIDGNEELALKNVENFSALVDGFNKDADYGSHTLLVSSGDNIIPGPRFYASEQSIVRAVTGSNEPGHIDIAFLNHLGVKASVMGNHDLDAGPGEFADAIQAESKDGVEFPGSLFPYLSANLDFSTDGDTAEILAPNGELVDNLHGKVAASAVAVVNGEKIGLVGISTPLLDTITSVGGITVHPASKDLQDLAAHVQPVIDELTQSGINKIIVLAHMQQITVEKELARLLKDVDVIVGGGSNTRMGDSTDSLFTGDEQFEGTYPFETSDANDKPLLIVNVDGDYKYLGRLVVGFDADGFIVRESLDTKLNGSWASTSENVAALGGSPIQEVVQVRDAVQDVINAQYGNVLGYTNVYLDGRRSQVRTQETNLGNLTADAIFWYANLLSDTPVDIAFKNGGGIRTEIGSAIVPPGSVDYSTAVLSPPAPNEEAGTAEGAITEGHLRATLRFDNGLATLSLTAAELKEIIEHGVAATEEGSTPGRFPQVSGMRVSFDITKPAGSRVQSLDILNEDGSVKDSVVVDGAVNKDAKRKFRMVTLNFLANGGDDYPFANLSAPDRRNLYEGKGFGEEVDYPDENLANDPGANSSFSATGNEQDALAEYLLLNHKTPETAFNIEETDKSQDTRIVY